MAIILPRLLEISTTNINDYFVDAIAFMIHRH